MFEFKDNFLMQSIGKNENCDERNFCSASSAADLQLAELAELVGNGSRLRGPAKENTLTDTADADSPDWTRATYADAPRLDFDLEEELNRAFHGHRPGDASKPTASADQSALEKMIAAELEQAMPAKEGAAVSDADAALEDFSDELARLLDEPVNIAPPAPVEAAEPWSAPQIVDAPKRSAIDADAQSNSHASAQWDEFETSEGEANSDPTADLQPAVAKASELRDAHVESVVSKANAFENTLTGHGSGDRDESELAMGLDAELRNEYEQDDSAIAPPTYVAAQNLQKKRTGRHVAAALVAIAAIGGTAAFAWSFIGSDGQEPATILASTEPVKIAPKETGGKVVPNQDQSVYREVQGVAPAETKQEALKESAEKPVEVASSKLESSNSVTDSQTTGGPILKARRVRTVVVRPDGSIVTPGVENAASEARQVTLETANPSTPEISQPAPENRSGTDGQNTPVKTAEAQPSEVVQEAAPEPAAPAAKTKPELKPVEVAKVEPKPEPVAEVPKAKSPYAVQIASRRSAEAAKTSYNALAKKYASVLNGQGVDYQKTQVKGTTYFRVRIPASSKKEAQRICSGLKSRGGDCFVTR